MRWCWLAMASTACSFQGAAVIDASGTGDGRASDAPASAGNARKITFLDQASTAPLIDFPVLIRLDPATIDYATIANPRTDLAFADPDATPLPFDIDTWTPGGESDVWVKVPKIDASSTDFITLHFGAGVQGRFDPAAVWSTYAYVVHLGSQLTSSIATTAQASSMNVGTGAGLVGEASTFAGTGPETIDLGGDTGPLFNAWDKFTLELWVYPDYTAAPTGEPAILGKGSVVSNGRLITQGSDLQIDFAFQAGTKFLHAPVTWKHWNQLVYTYDGAAFALYHDGAAVISNAITGSLPNSGLAMVLGGASPLTGAIDELRVAHAGRSADWIRAEYLAATRQFTTIAVLP